MEKKYIIPFAIIGTHWLHNWCKQIKGGVLIEIGVYLIVGVVLYCYVECNRPSEEERSERSRRTWERFQETRRAEGFNR